MLQVRLPIAVSALASILYRASAALVLFVGLRAATAHLGTDQVAAYVLFTYLQVIGATLDVGSSMASLTPATVALAKHRYREVWLLLGLAIRRAIWGLAAAAVGLVILQASFSTQALDAARPTDVVLLAGAVMLLTVVQALTVAMAQAHFAYAEFCGLGTLGNLVSVGLFAAGVPAAAGFGWLGYGAVSMLPGLVATLGATVWVLARIGHRAKAEPANVDGVPTVEARVFHKHANSYFVMQTAGVMLAALDIGLLKWLGHASAAAVLGSVLRGLQIFSTPLLLLINQLWPVYAKLGATGGADHRRSLFTRSLSGCAIVGLLSGLLIVMFGDQMLRLIYRGDPSLLDVAWTPAASSGAAAYLVTSLIVASVATFLNGAGLVAPQLWASLLFIALIIPAKLWFASIGSVAGLLWATAVLLPAVNLVVLLPRYRHQLRVLLGRQ